MSANEMTIRPLIERYRQKAFAFAFYLAGGDPDRAYTITAAGFVTALTMKGGLADEEHFLTNLLKALVKDAAVQQPAPRPSGRSDAVAAGEAAELAAVRSALLSLPVQPRALILLRDQLHRPYREIADIMRLAPDTIRTRTEEARAALRAALEELLRHG